MRVTVRADRPILDNDIQVLLTLNGGYIMPVEGLAYRKNQDHASYRWACVFLACMSICGVVSEPWLKATARTVCLQMMLPCRPDF